jgi:hypothetical protein
MRIYVIYNKQPGLKAVAVIYAALWHFHKQLFIAPALPVLRNLLCKLLNELKVIINVVAGHLPLI